MGEGLVSGGRGGNSRVKGAGDEWAGSGIHKVAGNGRNSNKIHNIA